MANIKDWLHETAAGALTVNVSVKQDLAQDFVDALYYLKRCEPMTSRSEAIVRAVIERVAMLKNNDQGGR